MQGIFNDERRGHEPISPDRLSDGLIFSLRSVANGLCGPTTLRRPLLAQAKNQLRHCGDISTKRPYQ